MKGKANKAIPPLDTIPTISYKHAAQVLSNYMWDWREGDCSVVHVPHMMLLGNIVVGPARVQACPARIVGESSGGEGWGTGECASYGAYFVLGAVCCKESLFHPGSS